MRSRFAWWYNPIFLLVELLQAVIGILTLTLYQPCLTTTFATWHNKYNTQKEMEQEYDDV